MTLQNRFDKWDRENPVIWHLFQHFTFQVIAAGAKNCSAWLIANRIRWETTVMTTGEDYKIPNDFIALFSRKFMEQYPAYDGFFRTREMSRY